MIANTGEHVGNLPLRPRCITNAIRRQQWKFQSSRDLDDRMIARFFFTIEMTLQLGINIFLAENIDKFLCGSLGNPCVSVVNISRNRSIVFTSQAN